MNLAEFAALKPGDKIVNNFSGSAGTVSRISDGGVYVTWGPSPMEFTYVVNSTAWMQWSKVDDGL